MPQPSPADKTLFAWRPRNWFQLGVFILTLAIGLQFYIFYRQAAGDGPVTVARPPGVEGFLPIGALMGWKLFAQTGTWDPVHPAAMVILGFAALVSLLLRKSFCAWFCPVGTLSEWLWRWGRKIVGRNFQPPRWIDIPARGLKYLLLGFFLWIIGTMDAEAIEGFLQSPYYRLSDVKMLFFFTRMSALTTAVLAVLIIGSLFIRNFWCRYLCPYGALMGLLAWGSPTRVVRNRATCIDCRRCTRVCPAYLPVHAKGRIVSPECSGCLECAAVCPVADTLRLETRGAGKRAWRAASLGVVIVLLFLSIVYFARIGGLWESRVPQSQIRLLLKDIDNPAFTHPGLDAN